MKGPEGQRAAFILTPALFRSRALLEFLTTKENVGILSNMPAEPLLNERHILDADTFVEIVVWRVPAPLKGSRHRSNIGWRW